MARPVRALQPGDRLRAPDLRLGSDARGKAHVHVVICGLDRREAARKQKRLFSYPDINGDPEESGHAALSPYLFDAAGWQTRTWWCVRKAHRSTGWGN